ISGTHSFSGGITVNAGTLRPGGNQSLGANGQVLTIKDGATLDTNGAMNANREYEAVIAGSGVGGLGAIINTGASHNNGFRKITLTADATIGGSSRWDLRPVAGSGSFAAEVDLGGFTLTKTGTNNIALADATLSNAGGIAINEGMLSFTRMNVSGWGTVHVSNGAVLRFENYTIGSFTKAIHIQNGMLSLIGNAFTLASPISLTGTATIDAAVNLTASEPVSGTGSLVKTGTGLVTLLGANDYSGTTTVNTGSLVIGSQTTPGTLGAGEAITNANLVINRGDNTYVVSNTISGTGTLTIGQNTGGSFDSLVTLTGTNTFSGNLAVSSGGVKIFNPAALGTGPKNIGLTNGTAGRPQFYLDGSGGDITLPADFSFQTSSTNRSHPAIGNLAGNNVIEGNITMTSGGGSTAVEVLGGSLTLNGGITANVADRFLLLGGVAGANGTVNGTISNGTNPVGVQKLGENTWTLTGSNSYTGTTTVNGGTLLVQGDQSTATGNVTVNAGATLGGTGVLGGTVIANAGSIVAPGTSVGTLTATGALLNGNLAIEIDGDNADRLDITGSLNISGATLAVSETGLGATKPVYIIGSYALLTGQFAATTGVPAGYGIDYNYNGLKQIALVEGMLTPFQAWMDQFTGLTNPADKLPGADPDGDGGNNLREFALNGDPTNAAKNGYLAGRAAAVPGVGNAFILTFAARAGTNFNGTATAAMDGVTYTVRGSLDLQGFPAGVTEVVPAIVPAAWPAAGAGYQYHTFRLNPSTGLPGKGFLRLELSE
ncbi:MAG: autotransporter-associated beta strand repeat-containing protein, partial [Akkermansiaceae bacterium]|nr:autotransporter-associated beta strand repeat-containing protein [Akkermansiaceae bacterium]